MWVRTAEVLEGHVLAGPGHVRPRIAADRAQALGFVAEVAENARAAARALAERTLAERRRVLALLTGRGVDVVDAGPDALAPALADRYLAIKSRGWF